MGTEHVVKLTAMEPQTPPGTLMACHHEDAPRASRLAPRASRLAPRASRLAPRASNDTILRRSLSSENFNQSSANQDSVDSPVRDTLACRVFNFAV